MNQPLPSYPDYKPADLPWLEEVPAHWEIKRSKEVFCVIDQRSQTGAEEKLTVSSKNGVVPRREQKVTMFMAASYVGHKLCWPGDLVVNSLWAWANGLGFAKHHGIISTAYSVYRPLPAYAESGKYLDYLLRSSAFQWELQVGSKGIWISRLQLTDDTFLRMPIVLPPLQEQLQIVKFLEVKGSQIMKLLKNKRQLIKLLQEQKQALIKRTVTQGLNPTSLRKDSGVSWLGDVPAHWEVKKFKYSLNFIRGGMTPSMSNSDFWNGSIPWVSPKDMKQEIIKDSELHVTDKAIEETGLGIIPAGSILAVVRSGILRNRFPLAINEIPVTLNQDMKAFQPKASISTPKYLYTLLQGLEQEVLRQSRKAVATVESIEMPDLANMRLPFPPLDEQKEIIAFLAEETHLIDEIIDRAQREIGLIQEYRTRLVSDVVTGRVDVRHLTIATTAPLPEEDDLLDEEDVDEDELIEETLETDG